MASPAPMLSPAARARGASGAKTPLKSPLGRTCANDDAAEKERAAKSRAANELRRRCVSAARGARVSAGSHLLTAEQARNCSVRLTPLVAARSLESDRENEPPSGAASVEPPRAKAATLSTAAVLDLYSNWCARRPLRAGQPRAGALVAVRAARSVELHARPRRVAGPNPQSRAR
jgi:hypothetical protein